MTDALIATRAMSPGTYLQKRRGAAGHSVKEVALIVADNGNEVSCLVEFLDSLEQDLPLPQLAVLDFIDRLDSALAIPFDKTVLLALIGLAADPNPDLPHPQICRECACSWCDPCCNAYCAPWADPFSTCSWAEADLCSRCAGDAR